MDLYRNSALILVIVAVLTGCSQPDKGEPEAFVKGQITVSDSLDETGNFSGIEVTIIKRDSAQADADTLFYQVTDSSGTFSGVARFPEKKFYPLLIDRNNRRIGRANVILAPEDTLVIDGVLPNLEKTLSLSSDEHIALEQFQRVNRNFRRVQRYINMGALKGDSLTNEIKKWGNIYWDLHRDQEGTLAGQMAAVEAIKLYHAIDGSMMMDKIRLVHEKDELAGVAAQYGSRYLATHKGLDHSLNYLDSLSRITEQPAVNKRIQQEHIKLLYDSARIDQAREKLELFKKQFKEDEDAGRWAENIGYDLTYLSPGDTIPAYSFQYDGMTVSRDSMIGTPYILEITLLSNRLYQQQFDRTFVIHNIYKNFGLDVITIPLDQSQVTVDAFFEERKKAWPVADAQAFDKKELLDKFNVRFVPTRFLIDREGKIVRKYIGREYQDVIKGIQSIIKKDEAS